MSFFALPTSSESAVAAPAGARDACLTELNVEAAIAAAVGVDRRMAHLASHQHGRVAQWQLAPIGIDRHGISRRLRAGRLHQAHYGVYAVGYPTDSLESLAMGAVLAGGPGSMSSHDLATQLLWAEAGTGSPKLEISVRTPGGRRHPGLEIHRNCRLHPLDCNTVKGIPTTTGPRTLMDCATRLGESRLYQAVGRAYRAGALDRAGLQGLLQRSQGLRGVALLRDATEELWMEPARLRSELEAHFLALCRAYPTPTPQVNQRIPLAGRFIKPDFYWPEYRLVVETDGFAFHSDPHAHEEDRKRDQDLKLIGIDVFRYTWRQVTREPHRIRMLFDRYFPRV